MHRLRPEGYVAGEQIAVIYYIGEIYITRQDFRLVAEFSVVLACAVVNEMQRFRKKEVILGVER